MSRINIEFGPSECISLTVEHRVRNNMKHSHSHDSCELYFLTEGERYLFAGGDYFHVRAGDVFLIPPGLEHRTLDADGAEYSKIICMIPPRLVPREISSLTDVRIVRLTAGAHARHSAEIEASLSSSDTARFAAVAALVSLVTTLKEHREPVASLPLGRMGDIITYIDEHYLERINLTELSEKLFISEFYLCRLFKEHTGRTVLSYVTALRVARAQRLLRTTDMSVERVARAAGFGSVSAFSKAFLKSVGVSARAYRASGKAAD